MASPRVFISSTCYDLKHIRESLKYFVKNMGYEPVLSDDGDVFYNPQSHTHDSCLDEVSNCQIFVLIIGGRYGGIHKDSLESITNEEYRIASANNIPIFTLVDMSVSSDHHLYQSNGKNKDIDRDKVKYPASDNVKIFHFINEVRKKSVNNAIQPFRNFLDIEIYLKKQWAGMLFDFLLKSKNEEQSNITNKLLSDLSMASKKTEELVKFVYEKLDDANAQKVINTVSDKVEAEKFVDTLCDLNNAKFSELDIERLVNTPMNGTWSDYLVKAAGFTIETGFESDSEKFIWGPGHTFGLIISRTNSYSFALEKSFEALKSLEDSSKREIFESLIA